MLKEYDIDINFLEYLREMIKSNGTEYREVDLFLLNRLIHILSNHDDKEDYQPEVIRQLEEDTSNLSFYKPYYPYVRSFRSKGNNPTEPFEPVYSNIGLSDKDTLDLVGDFYHHLGEDYQEDYSDFLDDGKDHLKFINPNTDIEGETTFINSTEEFFCLVPDYQDITKATILVHETTHIFDWYMRPEFIKSYLIHEFNALFKEMIASDYFAMQLGLDKDNLKRRYYVHTLIKKYADDVFYRMQILHLFDKDENHNMSKIYDMFGDEYIKYLTKDSLVENYVYQIAYLIAIELYSMYQKDQDKALWLSKYIVDNANNANIKGVLYKNGIVLNGHSLEYEDSLKKGLGI